MVSNAVQKPEGGREAQQQQFAGAKGGSKFVDAPPAMLGRSLAVAAMQVVPMLGQVPTPGPAILPIGNPSTSTAQPSQT